MLIAQTDAEELPSVTVNPYFSFGTVTKTVSEMKQHLNEFSNEELVKVAKTGVVQYDRILLSYIESNVISTHNFSETCNLVLLATVLFQF